MYCWGICFPASLLALKTHTHKKKIHLPGNGTNCNTCQKKFTHIYQYFSLLISTLLFIYLYINSSAYLTNSWVVPVVRYFVNYTNNDLRKCKRSLIISLHRFLLFPLPHFKYSFLVFTSAAVLHFKLSDKTFNLVVFSFRCQLIQQSWAPPPR